MLQHKMQMQMRYYKRIYEAQLRDGNILAMVNMSECWRYEASVVPVARRRVSSKKDGNMAKIPIIISNQTTSVSPSRYTADMAARIAVTRVDM
jgi:hypothetical protein